MEANGTFSDRPSTNGENTSFGASKEMQTTVAKTAKKPRGKPFSKGHKGCGGRPKGATKAQKQGKSTGRRQDEDPVLTAMRKKAIQGNVSAARFVKDFELPTGNAGPTLSERTQRMLADPERMEFERRLDQKYLRDPDAAEISSIPVLSRTWALEVEAAERKAKEGPRGLVAGPAAEPASDTTSESGANI